MTTRIDSRLLPAQSPRGSVLIDVLTCMTFVLLLVGAAQTWARAVLFTHRVLEASATAQEEAGLAIDALARDIRNAGFDAGTAVSPIVAATRESIEVLADLNGDGDTDDGNEHVRYAYRADRRQITRASGRGNPQPFADDVPAGGLSFTLWDESGQAVGGTGADDVKRIGRIDVRLQIELPNPDPRAVDPIRAEAFTVVALRNR